MKLLFQPMFMMSHMRNKQAGISLMLAVLILSAMTAIAFSLATIVFIEIRSSGDVVRTEPNLYASFGLTEEGLLQFKRFVSTTDMDITQCGTKYDSVIPGVCSLNNVSLSLPQVGGASQPIQYDDSPTVKVVYGGSKMEIPMYQPNVYTKQYSKVRFDILPGATNNLKVAFRKTNASGAITYDPVSYPVNGSAYSVAVNTPFTYSAFDNTNQFDMILDNSTAGSKDVSVEISTFDPNNNTVAKGLPFIGQDVLKIVADYLGLTRTYKVQIPLVSSAGQVSNVAAATAGATAVGYFNNGTAPNEYSASYPASSTINGDRRGVGWAQGTGGWNSDISNPLPNWLQVNFAGQKSISEIDVYTLADAFPLPSDPDASTPAGTYGVRDFVVQYDSDPTGGTTWTTVPGGTITNNILAWKQFTFPTVSTDKIRVYITAVNGGYSRLVEVEAQGF